MNRTDSVTRYLGGQTVSTAEFDSRGGCVYTTGVSSVFKNSEISVLSHERDNFSLFSNEGTCPKRVARIASKCLEQRKKSVACCEKTSERNFVGSNFRPRLSRHKSSPAPQACSQVEPVHRRRRA